MSLPPLPTLKELQHPDAQPEELRRRASSASDPLDPIHLFNITWRPDGQVVHRVLPKALTGVDCNIVVMSALHFPTGSHKVGPAFSVLREKLLDGEITQDGSTLVFPSTGNFGIGGAWVGPRLGFKSLVVLPEEMSSERFEKIRGYGAEIIATPGCESNVKEIYDKVNELRRDPQYRILNQFEEMGNYRFHYHVTGGSALELATELGGRGIGDGRIAAFVSAMGSAGTIAAGDHIKAVHPGARIVGLEPIQCPTLYNCGYGGHAIEGIGDKHVTWVHNVTNMDLLCCIDDQMCLETLQLLEEGQAFLAAELGLDTAWLESIRGLFGISATCNIIGAIKAARYYGFGSKDTVFTVATDGVDRYPSVLARLTEQFGEQTDAVASQRLSALHDVGTDWTLEGTQTVRRRWHNQKYFTWVEQQGKSVDELNALLDQEYWSIQAARAAEYDAMILERRPS